MNINHLMYADDLVVFSPSSVGLRELLSVCETYGLNHDIKFNHKKNAILISRGKHIKNVCHLAFKLNGEDIKEVKSVKYLGHIICSDSKDDKNISVSVANCMPVVMYYLGNSICAQMMSRSSCLVHFAHLCIQLNCGGIILYIASTDYMYATIMCLDGYLDYPNTAALQLCLQRD